LARTGKNTYLHGCCEAVIRSRHFKSFRIVIGLAVKFQILPNSQNWRLFSQCSGSGSGNQCFFLTPGTGNRDKYPRSTTLLIVVALLYYDFL
jgi:hypothetical protein